MWCPSARTKRRKLLGPSPDDKELTEQVSKRRKTAAKSLPESLQPFAQLEASTAGRAETGATEQPLNSEEVANKPVLDRQEPQTETAVSPGECTHEQAPFDFVAWYSKVCTHSFADGLSALQEGQDSSHAQPSMISKCIRMNASLFEGNQAVLQTVNQSWHFTPFQHASHWL